MIVKNALNGGLAEVDAELGKKLIATGGWVEASAAPKAARKPRAVKEAPAEEPVSEE